MKVITKKPKKAKQMAHEAEIEIESDIPEIVTRFNSVFDSLNDLMVSRQSEITGLKLAMLTRQNMMISGPKGNAKTMFAEAAFARVRNSRSWARQFMKGTLTDEVFGPMRIKKLKEEEIFEYNTEGMLPTAHFALCDEVYRAADSMLDSVLRILNEHCFFNGTKDTKCPLITALGTTNFITESEELEAFHDRWLIRMHVEYLSAAKDVTTMLSRFLSRRNKKEAPEAIELEDIHRLIDAAASVIVPDEVIELYEELVRAIIGALGNKSRQISDRRICQSLTLAQVSHLLECEGSFEQTMSAEHLSATIYGLCRQGPDSVSQGESNAFETCFQRIVTTSLSDKKVTERLGKAKKKLEQILADYDPNLKPRKTVENTILVSQLLTALESGGPEVTPSSIKGKELLRNLIDQARGLQTSYNEIVDKTLLKKTIQEMAEDSKEEADIAAENNS